MKNKKALLGVPGSIADIYAIVGFVLVLIIFIFLFQIQGCNSKERVKAEIQSKAESINTNMVLLNYLRTPVIVDGQKMDIADLISLYYSNQVYENDLITNIAYISSKTNSDCFVLCIDDEKFEFNDCSFYDTECMGLKQIIPYPEGNTITIQLDLDPAGLDIG